MLGIILVCGITLAVKKAQFLGPGDLITYFYLFIRFVQMFSDLSKTSSSWTLNRSQLEDVMNWWDKIGGKLQAQFKQTEFEQHHQCESRF